MGMTLKELLTKGEGTLSAQEAKDLAAQCRMDVETLYTLLEERSIKILDNETEADTSLDVDSIIAEVENAENNSDDMGISEEEEESAEENPADLKAAMDELLDDPVKNYLKQIGQIPLLSAEQEVELSRRIHAGAEAAHILQADRQKYGAPEYIKKNSARFSFEEDENSRSYTEDLDEEGNEKSSEPKEQAFQLLVDIQGKMAEGKSVGYKKWATKFNLKEMSKTLLFLQEQKISSAEELRERAAAATERYHAMGDSIKAAETRLAEIAVRKTHIINYAKTRPVYDAYRKSGYSKKFLEAHREEITLHKAAKAAFDEAGLQKLPKVKELDAESAELLTKKKAAYPDYRKARNEMQELMKAQKNVELFFAEDKSNLRPQHTR